MAAAGGTPGAGRRAVYPRRGGIPFPICDGSGGGVAFLPGVSAGGGRPLGHCACVVGAGGLMLAAGVPPSPRPICDGGGCGGGSLPTIRRASFWQRACKVLAPADRWAFLRASALQTPSGWGLGRSRGRQRDCSAPWPRRAYHGGYGRHAHRLFEPPPQQLTRTAAERWWGLVFRGCLRG